MSYVIPIRVVWAETPMGIMISLPFTFLLILVGGYILSASF